MANLKLQTGAGGLPAAPNALGLADLIIVGQSGGLATTGTSYRSNFTDAKALVLAGLTAANVANVPAGNIAAVTVQAAIAELDAEKAGLALANTFSNANVFDFVNQILSWTDNTAAVGPLLQIRRLRAVPAIGDFLGVVDFQGNNNLGTNQNYARIGAQATGVTSGATTSNLYMSARVAGVTTTVLTAGPGLLVGNASGGVGNAGEVNAVNYFDDGVNINTIYAGLAAANVFTQPQTINAGSGFGPGVAGFTVRSDDAGALGPFMASYHNSASPAVSDTLGSMGYYGKNSAAADYLYANLLVQANNVTAGAEAAMYTYYVSVAGARNARFSIGAGAWVVGATGTDQGAGTFNATSYYANGNLAVDTNALLRTRSYTVGTLPAASGVVGAIARVTDALVAPVYAAAATGGGTTFAKVVSDGTIWRYG